MSRGAPARIVEQDAAFAEYLSKYLILGPEVIIDLLLPVVDPAGENEVEQKPRLKNEVHDGPVAVEEDALASGLGMACQRGRTGNGGTVNCQRGSTNRLRREFFRGC